MTEKPERTNYLLSPHGGAGYRFNLKSGQIGATWFFKKPNAKDPWGSFVSFVDTIVGQQLSGKAAQTIFGRLEPLCDRFLNPAAICAIHPQKFLMAGLSRAKTSYVTDIAKLFADADIAMGQPGGWTKRPSGALSTRRDNF
jgi:hypothetical protein